MPQLDVSTYAPQLIWLTITFGVTFLIIWKLAAPRISNVLEARQFRIEDNLGKAEEHQREAEAALQDYKETLQQARETAQDEINKINSKMGAIASDKQEELDIKMNKKLQDSNFAIESAVNDAIKTLPNIANEIAAIATLQLIEKTPKNNGTAITKDSIKKT